MNPPAILNTFEHFNLPTFILQAVAGDFILTAWNKAADELLGNKLSEEPKQISAEERLKDRPDLLDALKTCLREKALISLQTEYTFLLSGDTKSLYITLSFVPPDCVIAHVEDLTENAKLHSELVLLRKAVDASKDLIVVINRNLTFSSVNNAYLAYQDRTRDKVIGKRIETILGTEIFTQSVKPHLEACFQTGKSVRFELQHTYPGKGFRTMAVSYDAVRNRAGEISHIVAVIRDITERKQAEEQTRIQRKNLLEAERLGNIGHWEWGAVSGKLFWSDQLYRIFGVTEDFELSLSSIERLIHPEDRGINNRNFRALNTSEPSAEYEFRIIRPDGDIRYIIQRIIADFDNTGTMIRAFGVMQDITNRKINENRLRELHEQTKKDASFKEQLLREVNHRIANNLSILHSIIEFYKQQLEEESSTDPGSILSNILYKVRSLSKLHSILSASGWQDVSIYGIIYGIIRASMETAPPHITITPAVSKVSEEIMVSTKIAHDLSLILNELVINTIKHHGSLTNNPEVLISVDISLGGKNGLVSFVYRDNGQGYPDEVLRGLKKSIGIQLVTWIVESNLRGTIDLTTDGGAVTKITFPLQR